MTAILPDVRPPAKSPVNSRQSLVTLKTGTRLGRFEVLAPIGAGGMGEVYRGRDTRLKREGNTHQYDVAKDGRFLVNSLVDGIAATPLTLVVNWPALLKQKSAGTR